jgi:alkyldihydroxyacetonephosphate synthase
MRRWNGWGDESARHPLPEGLASRLLARLGPGRVPQDAPLATSVAQVAASRLAPSAEEGTLLSRDPEDRLRHARGQAFHDLVALRSGAALRTPDAVARPSSAAEVRALLALAQARGVRLIPWGGGTSVAGHVNVEGASPPGRAERGDDAPVITVDLGRLSRLEGLDERDRLATFGAGVSGPALEAQLAARGFMLGHFPQSFELSTLGGWIATRSRGQESLGFGRIEELFAGGRVEAPAGTLEVAPHPSSSTGPDLRELVLGSEGRLGLITHATVHVRPLPEASRFAALLCPDWERALACVQSLAQDNPGLSMVRLSTPEETAAHLSLALPARAGRLLPLATLAEGRCLLLLGARGPAGQVRRALAEARSRARGALPLPLLGARWERSRFKNPYLRDALWERGYGVETVETAARFSRLGALRADLEQSLRGALAPFGEQADVFTHLSHVYPSGANVYTTFLFRLGGSAEATLARWRALKTAASEAIVRQGATISHQHGVGVDHKPYLAAEKGPLGLAAVRAALGAFDPAGLLNPGKLV